LPDPRVHCIRKGLLGAIKAQEVKKFLMTYAQADAGADRYFAIGYGEERLKNPVDPEASENRRVEIINFADQE